MAGDLSRIIAEMSTSGGFYKEWLSLSTSSSSSGRTQDLLKKRTAALRKQSENYSSSWINLSIPADEAKDELKKSMPISSIKHQSPIAALPVKKRKVITAETSVAVDIEERTSNTAQTGSVLLPIKKRKVIEESSVKMMGHEMPADQGRNIVECPRPAAEPMPLSQLLLTKKVTQSDANREQHRFQLTQADINRSMHGYLKELAELARKKAVAVKVLDRNGNVHDLSFKFLTVSKTYRFMGKDYTEFLTQSELKGGQTMEIWSVMPAGNDEEHRLAFINSDQ